MTDVDRRVAEVLAPVPALLEDAPGPAPEARRSVKLYVERFDRRGTEPFELFRSEFGQNSGIFVRIHQKLKKVRDA